MSSGPGASLDGSACWATVVDGWYLNDTLDHLQLPAVDLSSIERPVLSFWQWYEIDSEDYGVLEVDTGAGWEAVEPIYGYPDTSGFTGSSQAWTACHCDLTGLSDASQVRWASPATPRGPRLAGTWTTWPSTTVTWPRPR